MRRIVLAGLIALAPVTAARADDPVFVIEFKDGVITPPVVEVPANTRFKLEIHNRGSGAAEFESAQLQREKVVAAGASSFVVIRRLDPGEYSFFDEYHPEMKPGRLVAK